MTFTVTALPARILGGLPATAGSVPGYKAGSCDLVQFLHEQIVDTKPPNASDEVITAYLPGPDGAYLTLVCRHYAEVSDIPATHVFTRIPKGIYALFTPTPGTRDPRQDVWAQAESAADSGAILRARQEELEVHMPSGGVELYIAITL